ncbi:putative carbonic anhydrase [Dioscorea sansibarensis]
MGSLTAPPCTKNITWTVIQKLGMVSRAQVVPLKSPLNADAKRNARPPQPLNFRTILLYPSPKLNLGAI